MTDCINHPGVPATGTCGGCAESFCSRCLVPVKGQQFCAACKTSAISGKVLAGSPLGDCQEASDSLKYALIGIICVGFILGPIAIVKGIQARRMIAENPRLGGSGKALAGIIVGTVVLILNVVGILARISMATR